MVRLRIPSRLGVKGFLIALTLSVAAHPESARFAEASALTGDFRLVDPACEYECGAGVAINSDRVFATGTGIEIAGDEDGIFIRAFDFNGDPISDPRRLNDYTAGTQTAGRISIAGESVFAGWRSEGQDGSGYSAVGRKIGNDGQPIGSERILTETTLGDQKVSGMIGLGNDEHLVFWRDSGNGAWLRIIDGEGNPLTDEKEVLTEMDLETCDVGVVSNDKDRFMLIRRCHSENFYDTMLQFQLYDTNGNLLGGEQIYDTKSTDFWMVTSVAMRRDGGFFVVWDTEGSISHTKIVVMQRFDESAVPIGEQIVLGEDDTISEQWPTIAMTEDGHAFVAWMVNSDIGGPPDANSHSEIAAVWLDPDGNKIGEIFQANESTYWGQQFPEVDVNSDGVAAVVWTTYDELYGKFSLWGRLFQYDGDDLGPDDDDTDDDSGGEPAADEDDDSACGC